MGFRCVLAMSNAFLGRRQRTDANLVVRHDREVPRPFLAALEDLQDLTVVGVGGLPTKTLGPP